MRNVLKILKRDLLRLLKTPQALVVVFALMVIPSLYTWYNVVGFWNPYDNTGNLTVCVVNQDAGGSSELTGELNVGERIVDQLHENDQLHWEFTDYDAAMNELKGGRAYAAYVIPEHFTADPEREVHEQGRHGAAVGVQRIELLGDHLGGRRHKRRDLVGVKTALAYEPGKRVGGAEGEHVVVDDAQLAFQAGEEPVGLGHR